MTIGELAIALRCAPVWITRGDRADEIVALMSQRIA